MSEAIELQKEETVVLAVEFDASKRLQVRINTKNEALLALALRKATQCVDYYLEEQELQAQAKAQSSIITNAPKALIDKINS